MFVHVRCIYVSAYVRERICWNGVRKVHERHICMFIQHLERVFIGVYGTHYTHIHDGIELIHDIVVYSYILTAHLPSSLMILRSIFSSLRSYISITDTHTLWPFSVTSYRSFSIFNTYLE